MVQNLINEFRQSCGKEPIKYWNNILDDHCLSHTLAMINLGDLYHTPKYYLKDYSEIVAYCDFRIDWPTTLRYLIFEEIGKSEEEEHKKILLESRELGYGIMSDKEKIYITIRGR